jgi:hypothetical protein
MAVRGDAPMIIQWTGGHTDMQTTQGYIDRGRVERQRIGEPLPPLPLELLPDGPAQPPTGLDPSLDQAELAEATLRESLAFLRSQRELKRAIRRPRLSSPRAESTAKQAASQPDAVPTPGAFVYHRGPGKTDPEAALRQAIAALMVAGEDDEAARLQATLAALKGARLRAVG